MDESKTVRNKLEEPNGGLDMEMESERGSGLGEPQVSGLGSLEAPVALFAPSPPPPPDPPLIRAHGLSGTLTASPCAPPASSKHCAAGRVAGSPESSHQSLRKEGQL